MLNRSVSNFYPRVIFELRRELKKGVHLDNRKPPAGMPEASVALTVGLSRFSPLLHRLKITLSANVERYGVLVLVLVDGSRLRSRYSQDGRTGHLLVEVEPHGFSRE